MSPTTPAADTQVHRLVEVEPSSGRKPRSVERLRDWEYLERQIHRLICAWGRFFCHWPDIVAVHRHVWEQAECVRRLRERLVQFPGAEGNLDQPVARQLEDLCNRVLLAPSHEDAVDGIYDVLTRALTRSYAHYVASAHPVHDAPTLQLIGEILTIKEGFRLWLRDYRRRHPHATDASYAGSIGQAVASLGELLAPAAPTPGDPAQPAGVRTTFRLPLYPAKPPGTAPRADFMPYISADFRTSVEARRLFWCYGYMMEMNLAMDQLRWLYDAGPFMPWAFVHDVSRHLWDESRHGDSGHSRLLDFGIALQDVGFGSHEQPEPAVRVPLYPQACQGLPGARPACGTVEPMTPGQLYEQVFFIGMIAETGHFQVKREAYDDFKAGGDLASAEMMLFDIIDEQTHVQYAHRWLPVLAERAGIDNTDYRQRAAAERERWQASRLDAEAHARTLPRDPADAGYALYTRLLNTMRQVQPLANADDRAPRSPLPM